MGGAARLGLTGRADIRQRKNRGIGHSQSRGGYSSKADKKGKLPVRTEDPSRQLSPNCPFAGDGHSHPLDRQADL